MELINKAKASIEKSPPLFLALGFFIVIFTGGILLSLPISSSNYTYTNLLDCMFTSTSAVCVTGLVVLETATHWSLFGKIVILTLIQIGGLGFMTMATLVALLLGKRITLKSRLIIQEQMNAFSLAGMVKLIRYVLISTFTIEAVGAVILATQFVPKYGSVGIWYGIFHSISAFCNAGFDILGSVSLADYVSNPVVVMCISLLIILGGMGFNVYMDITANKTHIKKYALHTKIVLIATIILLLTGFFVFLILEYNNANTIAGKNLPTKALAAWFQSVTTRTAGFYTVNQARLTDSSAAFSVLLMFIGGSPAGTAGGIKTTTFALLWIIAINEIKGNTDIVVFKRRLQFGFVRRAITIALLGGTWIVLVTFILMITEPYKFLDLLFETTSALATVGLSRDLTPLLKDFSKVLLMITMYIGRVGFLTLVFAIAKKKPSGLYKEAYGNVILG